MIEPLSLEKVARWLQRRYYAITDFLVTSRGAADAHRPIVTDSGGKIDASFIDDTDIDHGSLGGLTDDDHPQYAKLAGRAGGQTMIGGTASGENYTTQSTAHATRGSQFLDDSKVYLGLSGSRLGVLTIPLATITSGQTLTVNITGATIRRTHVMRVFTRMQNTTSLVRYVYQIDDVVWQMAATLGTAASILGTVTHLTGASNGTITGPTAINDGIKYVITTSGASFTNGAIVILGMGEPITDITWSSAIT